VAAASDLSPAVGEVLIYNGTEDGRHSHHAIHQRGELIAVSDFGAGPIQRQRDELGFISWGLDPGWKGWLHSDRLAARSSLRPEPLRSKRKTGGDNPGPVQIAAELTVA